ncbi:hypothetical protein VTL71DRAFT_16175 [Oculimacula yallundae]|uniref:BZIP domain-containing protein n=1 Tax=Oculimacula yallundae TaxID=86028 RepID=A0ABR4CDQ4_9HELO
MTEPSFWKRSVNRFGRSKSGSNSSSKGDDEAGLRSASGSASGRESRGRGIGKETAEGGLAAFRFVEEVPVGKSKSPEVTTKKSDPAQAPKDKRRAQVRRAQIKHRQRFADKGKELEHQIIMLRERIAQTETQAVLFKHENIAMKTALQSNLVPLPHNFPLQPQNNNTNTNLDLDTMDLDFDLDFDIDLTIPTSLSWSNNTTLVRTTFDPFLDQECLQISPAGSFPLSVTSPSSAGTYTVPDLSFMDTSISLPSPDIFNSKSWKPAVLAQQEREKVYQQQQRIGQAISVGVGRGNLSDEEMEMLAINFILALEHPCRKHFSPPSTDPLDPTAAPSGHELMATTHLFSHASSFILPASNHNQQNSPHQHPHQHQHQDFNNPPFPHHNKPRPPTIFSPPTTNPNPNPTLVPRPKTSITTTITGTPSSSATIPCLHPTIGASPGSTWLIPSPTLRGLYAMSQSMPKENWEITPVQAWFLLEERYGWDRLLGKRNGGDLGSRGAGNGGEEEVGVRDEDADGVLDALKKGLAKLVKCLDFGSVVDERGFWGVVRSVLGEDGGSDWV